MNGQQKENLIQVVWSNVKVHYFQSNYVNNLLFKKLKTLDRTYLNYYLGNFVKLKT